MPALRLPALHAEWTKLRTAPGMGWLLLGLVASTVALSATAVAAAACPASGCNQDTARLSLTGIQVGQAIVALLAVLMISGEYSSRMIQVTLTATPRRVTVLAAKAAVLSGLVLVAGSLAVFGSVLAGRLLLPGRGLALGDGAVLRAVVGSVGYLVLIALLSLGVATLVRDAAVAMGVVIGLLYLFPIIATVVDPDWQRRLLRIGPMTAGLTVQATTQLDDLPLRPWVGLGVLAAWAAGALLVGGLVLRLRDA